MTPLPDSIPDFTPDVTPESPVGGPETPLPVPETSPKGPNPKIKRAMRKLRNWGIAAFILIMVGVLLDHFFIQPILKPHELWQMASLTQTAPEGRDQTADEITAGLTLSSQETYKILVDHYIDAMASGDAERKRRAGISLEKLQKLFAKPLLQIALGDDRERADAAIEALMTGGGDIQIPSEKLADFYIRRLASPKYETYLMAFQKLGTLEGEAITLALKATTKEQGLGCWVGAAAILASRGEPDGVERLIEALAIHEKVGLDRKEVNVPACKAALGHLRRATRRTFGFNPEGSQADRTKSINAWRAWWAENKGMFKAGKK